MRFSTRDLLWLMLLASVIAAGITTGLHRERQHELRDEYWQRRVRMLEVEQEQLIREADKLNAALDKAGIDPSQRRMGRFPGRPLTVILPAVLMRRPISVECT